MTVELSDSAERELVAGRRLWSVYMLASSVLVAESILRGRPVMARTLLAEPLRRALRGGPLPPPSDFVKVTGEMLDAINEAGPIPVKPDRRGRR